MRHFRSIVYAILLAPAIWVSSGAAFADQPRSAYGWLLLVAAGVAEAILLLAPISPAGPLLAGLVFGVLGAWAAIAPDSYAGLWPSDRLAWPGQGLAVLLAVPLVATALSARRWDRYEPPALPVIGTIGDARGTEQPARPRAVRADEAETVTFPAVPAAAAVSEAETTMVVTVPPGPRESEARSDTAPPSQPGSETATPAPAPAAGAENGTEPVTPPPAEAGPEPAAAASAPAPATGPEPQTPAAIAEEEPERETATAETVREPEPDEAPPVAAYQVSTSGEVTAVPAPQAAAEEPAADDEATAATATAAADDVAVPAPGAAGEVPAVPTAAATDEEPTAASAAIDEEPTAPTAPDEEPTVATAASEESTAATAHDEEPTVASATTDEEPTAPTAHDEEPTVATATTDEEPTAATTDEEPTVVVVDQAVDSDATQLMPVVAGGDEAESPQDGSAEEATTEDVAAHAGARNGKIPDSEQTQVITLPIGELATHDLRDRVPGEAATADIEELARAAHAGPDGAGERTQVLPRDRGEPTQVIRAPAAEQTQVIRGMVQPPGDRTQVLSIPTGRPPVDPHRKPPPPSLLRAEQPNPRDDPTTRLVPPTLTDPDEEPTVDVGARRRIMTVTNLERPADEAADDTRRLIAPPVPRPRRPEDDG